MHPESPAAILDIEDFRWSFPVNLFAAHKVGCQADPRVVSPTLQLWSNLLADPTAIEILGRQILRQRRVLQTGRGIRNGDGESDGGKTAPGCVTTNHVITRQSY